MSNKNNLFLSNRPDSPTSTIYALNWLLDIGYHHATMTRSQAMKIARVDRSTFERWEQGKSHAPAATLELLRLHAFGEPPSGFNNTWHGWKFHRDTLINTEWNYSFTPNDLKAVIYWQPLANKLGCENSSLKETVKELRNKLSSLETPPRAPLQLVINN